MKDLIRKVRADNVADWNIPFDLILKSGEIVVATAEVMQDGVLIRSENVDFTVSNEYIIKIFVPAFDLPPSQQKKMK